MLYPDSIPASLTERFAAPPAPTVLALWAPSISMLLLSFLSYVDRSVLGILSPTILRDLHLSATQYGLAISAFSICYMLANPLWGWAMDRFGLFAAVFSAVALWSLASGSHALMAGLTGMCLARGALGFGEGATFPAGLKTVAETLPSEKRSFGLGLAYSGGSLGAALTPLLITPLALRFGWRSAFVLTAAAGAAWIALWWLLRITGLFNTRPASIVAGEAAATPLSDLAATAHSRPLRKHAKWNRDLFASAAAYGLGALPLAFGLYAAPLYLSRVLHQSQASLGHLLWVPPAGWEAGYLIWGRIADRRRLVHSGRPTRTFALLSAAGFLLCLIPYLQHAPHALLLTMTLFFLSMFVAGGFVVLSLSQGMATQPAANTGFLAGVCVAAWSLATAFLMPVIGRMFDRGEYTSTFWLVAAFPVLGTFLWRLLGTNPKIITNPKH